MVLSAAILAPCVILQQALQGRGSLKGLLRGVKSLEPEISHRGTKTQRGKMFFFVPLSLCAFVIAWRLL